MAGRYLLDTNAAIALLNADSALASELSGAAGIYLPAVVVGELYFGAFKSGRVVSNLSKLQAFLSANVVLSCDAATGRHYGETKAALRVLGRPIPDNDLWIAAVAKQHNLTLVTRDAHFQHLPGQALVSW